MARRFAIPAPTPTDLPTKAVRLRNSRGEPTGFAWQTHTFPYLDALPLEELKNALATQDSAKAKRFLADISNPLYRNHTVTALAAKNGIGIPELHAVWRSYRTTEAMFRVLDPAPLVAIDTAEDAKSQHVCCTRCDGAGEVVVVRQDGQHWIPCPTCKGTLTQRRPGDKDSRRWVLEAAGVVERKSAIGVSVNVGTGATVESVLDELEGISRKPGAIDVTAAPDP